MIPSSATWARPVAPALSPARGRTPPLRCLDNGPPHPQTDSMIESRTEIIVRYAETDMMGIVYHGNYLPWFEVGRTTLLKECGLPYKELEAQGYHLPVIELAVKYTRPALYDDTLTVITRLREKPTLR